ncbi:VOC family protein [Nocardia suismassiliense]|uniref:VOC family protein n=1 Tax=Nocardia suismassiliense TaxID=2077092 RepID=A0ABW6QPC1_9NOCA
MVWLVFAAEPRRRSEYRFPMQLHHVFCMVDPAGDWARRLSEARLVLDQGTRHRGQGTRNRRLSLGPLYLELLWVCDRAEAAGNPLRLDRRADWARTGASPIGVGLRGQLPEHLRDQFWLYSDLGFPIWVQRGTPERPMVFVIDPPMQQPENPSPTASSRTGMIRSICLQAAAAAVIPRYDGPAITQTVGPARLDLVLDGGSDIDITDILALRTHQHSTARP